MRTLLVCVVYAHVIEMYAHAIEMYAHVIEMYAHVIEMYAHVIEMYAQVYVNRNYNRGRFLGDCRFDLLTSLSE